MTKQETNKETLEFYRMWASAAFVGVLIVIGVPLWWKTTEVYRVALPYDKISSFDKLPHIVASDLTVLANDEATAAEIASLIENEFKDSGVINLKVKTAVLSDELHHNMNAVADEVEALEEIGQNFDLTKHNSLYVVQRSPLFQHVWLGMERVAFFRDLKAAPTLVEALKRWVYQTSILQGARSDSADSARRTRFPPSDAYYIVLSVIQPFFGAMDVKFSDDAVDDYIGTFVDELSVLHNFTLKAGTLYFDGMDSQPKEVVDTSEWGRHYAVSEGSLPQLLTQLDERTARHSARYFPVLPVINLALYVVPCEVAPLAIYDHNDKKISSSVAAFMSPKWGGVMFSNPTPAECREEKPVHQPNIRIVMGTFISQLRKLLGITETEVIAGGYVDPLKSVSPRQWEVDNLLRMRTLEQLTSAERTLQSLAKLLGEISNIVINDEVGASINLSVEKIHEAIELMAEGDLVEAYRTSQEAFKAAETAFMDPSLLALLYFPDDQKYAIYIPLFLPIMFPVILSLKNLFLWFRKPAHKEKTE